MVGVPAGRRAVSKRQEWGREGWWGGGCVIESELFDIRLKCIEMKIRRDSHGCQSNPFRATQLVVTRLSGWTGGGRVNRPRQWCCCLGDDAGIPIPRTSATSPCALNPNRPPSHQNTHPPPLLFLHFSFSVGVLSIGNPLYPQTDPHTLHTLTHTSSSVPITKLSAQIKGVDSLTAAKHSGARVYKHTRSGAQPKPYT